MSNSSSRFGSPPITEHIPTEDEIEQETRNGHTVSRETFINPVVLLNRNAILDDLSARPLYLDH